MELDYKGKHYDTYKNEKLQLIEDKDFQAQFVREWFDNPDEVMNSTKLDLAYDLALMSARYEDIISHLTDEFSVAGTYPEWVVDAAEKKFEFLYGEDE